MVTGILDRCRDSACSDMFMLSSQFVLICVNLVIWGSRVCVIVSVWSV